MPRSRTQRKKKKKISTKRLRGNVWNYNIKSRQPKKQFSTNRNFFKTPSKINLPSLISKIAQNKKASKKICQDAAAHSADPKKET